MTAYITVIPCHSLQTEAPHNYSLSHTHITSLFILIIIILFFPSECRFASSSSTALSAKKKKPTQTHTPFTPWCVLGGYDQTYPPTQKRPHATPHHHIFFFVFRVFMDVTPMERAIKSNT
ncbi:uncharacterized protein TM35_000781050 [Trypanosoma theileri]|uniref:Uncharacterized protein n=1 Tax=Trypanosoma theileri TaxID=67003 RepID=A0A1X0NGI7_9TRYP|nr:uncharacterized protein TM35_000781050 [Trypanosoma theileri]ORC83137.1 hypothetical protein TM35_000781050 [Trypanosoma theileri]